MVGILVPFWHGLVSGAMLVSGRVYILTRFWWTNFSKPPKSHSNSPRSKCCAKPVAGANRFGRLHGCGEYFHGMSISIDRLLDFSWIPSRKKPWIPCIIAWWSIYRNLLVPGSVENFGFIFRTFDLNQWIWIDKSNCTRLFLTMALHAHHLKL